MEKMMRFSVGNYRDQSISVDTLNVTFTTNESDENSRVALKNSSGVMEFAANFSEADLADNSKLVKNLADVEKIVSLSKLEKIVFFIEGEEETRETLLAWIVEAQLLHYSRDLRFKGDENPAEPEMEFMFHWEDDPESAKMILDYISKRTMGVITARELGNIPPNLLYPARFAEEAVNLAESYGFSCEILEEEDLAELEMNAHLAVGQGSEKPPCLIIIDTKPGSDETPVALVGKGLTFDSGGISIKPAADMHKMKVDMGGAGAVLGIIDVLGRIPLEKRVIAVVGAAENMPDGRSYRPGDIIKTHKGITVEVLNTDAEGRMVLADALSYTVDRYEPELMIDLATLTGAMKVALGNKIVGMFGTDDLVCHEIMNIGAEINEPVWQMPLMPHFYDQIKSQVADIANVGGRMGGACTAAMFLKQFVGDTPWIHLDLAGAWGAKSFTQPQEGASGMAVRVISEFLRRRFSD
jgi:leucyl aminopeptidase